MTEPGPAAATRSGTRAPAAPAPRPAARQSRTLSVFLSLALLLSAFIVAGGAAVPASAAPLPVVQDPGFENQPGNAVSAPWGVEGPDPKGIDHNLGLQHSGSDNAWIRASTKDSNHWNAITQHVQLQPYTTYRLSGWVRTSANITGRGYFGIRGSSGRILKEVNYGAPAATPSFYQYLEVRFNSGASTSGTVYIGYWSPGADSWVQIDDVHIDDGYSAWAGYAEASSPHNVAPMRYVQASWTEPANFPCDAADTRRVSMWVGLGGFGYGDGNLVQLGTEATCSDAPPAPPAPRGTVRHYPWWESLTDTGDTGPMPLPETDRVLPGDQMTASVYKSPADPHRYTFYMADETRHWNWQHDLLRGSAAGPSADVVTESSAINGVHGPWPPNLRVDFRNVWFDGGMPYLVDLTPAEAIDRTSGSVYMPTPITSELQDGFSVISQPIMYSLP